MYNLISKSNLAVESILDVVARNRGVDKGVITSPSPKSLIHYSKLNYMNEAVQLFEEKMLYTQPNIVIVVDSDPDGYTSSAILTMYIHKNFPHAKVTHLFHKGREHGLTKLVVKQIEELGDRTNLLILPDSSSSDYAQHKYISSELNVPIIILDHHETDKVSEYAIVVNNQISEEYTNKSLSGVGIVYKFLQALDDNYGFNDANNYLDLLALGNVADVMNLASEETRYLVYKGVEKISNDLLKEFLNQNKVEVVCPHTLSFNVIPKMNAVIRIGTEEDKRELFEVMIGKEGTFYNTRRKANETLAYKMARESINIHKKQNKTKKEYVAQLKETIESQGWHKNSIIICLNTANMDKSLTGVLASSIAEYYRKPSMILTYSEKSGLWSGSYRGIDSVLPDTKEFLRSLGRFEYVEGHAQAGGVGIKQDNLKGIFDVIGEVLETVEGETLIDVDFSLSVDHVKPSIFNELARLEKHWGKGFEQPLFHIHSIKVPTNKIYVSTGGMVDFTVNDVKFTQFVGDVELISLRELQDKEVELEVVATLGVNNFRGQSNNQAIMKAFRVVAVTEKQEKKVDVSSLW